MAHHAAMTTHASAARDHIAATRAAMDQVDHLHATRPHDRAAIAAAYDSIRQGMKLAEVHALLHIGEQLEQINDKVRRS
jgi:hypothetical protein